ncbi:MAG: hypothetical protein JWM47_830 [Acidimicrobiales bacterium]|nr:hypothetical protein [Acidimicrobiales bacterium]
MRPGPVAVVRSVPTERGSAVPTTIWRPALAGERSGAAVLVLPGAGETRAGFGRCYVDLAHHLVDRGRVVVTADLSGAGDAPGSASFSSWVEEATAVRTMIDHSYDTCQVVVRGAAASLVADLRPDGVAVVGDLPDRAAVERVTAAGEAAELDTDGTELDAARSTAFRLGLDAECLPSPARPQLDPDLLGAIAANLPQPVPPSWLVLRTADSPGADPLLREPEQRRWLLGTLVWALAPEVAPCS